MKHNPSMGLLSRLFRGKDTDPGAAAPSQFQDSDSTTEQQGAKNAPRRELVQVVMRDTMRQHGIPSDWLECRILSVVGRKNLHGMHVQLIVRQGGDTLLNYVYAFQESFLRELSRFDPRADEWLFSLAWQFEGIAATAERAMPDPQVWKDSTGPATVDPALAQGRSAAQQSHDDVEDDLRALFAIRDAALRSDTSDPPDFEPTRPGFENSGNRR